MGRTTRRTGARTLVHTWVTSGNPKNTRSWCEACGRDKPKDATEAAKRDCRPTSLGFGIGGW